MVEFIDEVVVKFTDEVVAQAETRVGNHQSSPGAHLHAHLQTHPARASTGQRRSPAQTGVSLPRISVFLATWLVGEAQTVEEPNQVTPHIRDLRAELCSRHGRTYLS